MSTQSSHDRLQDLFQNASPSLFSRVENLSWFKLLLARANTLHTLQKLFDQECPLEVMGRCRVLEIKDGCLMVGVDNASSATQLRYRTRELLPMLRGYKEFSGVKKIAVSVLR